MNCGADVPPLNVTELNLVIPDTPDEERDRVAEAWIAAGGVVTRIGRFWDPPDMDRSAVRLYGNDTFVLVLAQKLELGLISPPDDLLQHMPYDLLQRDVRVQAIESVNQIDYPAFIKPVTPKQFSAGVYASPDDLAEETEGLSSETLVYVSEIVQFQCEARAFLLASSLQDVAVYEGDGNAQEVAEFVSRAAQQLPLPTTCVLDVGYIEGRGWAVIEANAAWGAGLNGCSAEKVIECISRATVVPESR
jgi:hypothetical protein